MVKTCKNEMCRNKGVAITRDKSKFCAKCGNKLSDVEVCAFCEHEFFPEDKSVNSVGDQEHDDFYSDK